MRNKMEIELYSDILVVLIKDDEGRTIDRHETASASVKDLRRHTKAQVDAVRAAAGD
jgi:hypothetical protein